jgi:transcriptional regulator with XRE-family HTH domain
MADETVGDRLARLCAERGIFNGTQKGLAEFLGVEYETLRKWKRGSASPTANRLKTLVEKTGLPAKVIMHGDEAPAPAAPDAVDVIPLSAKVKFTVSDALKLIVDHMNQLGDEEHAQASVALAELAKASDSPRALTKAITAISIVSSVAAASSASRKRAGA